MKSLFLDTIGDIAAVQCVGVLSLATLLCVLSLLCLLVWHYVRCMRVLTLLSSYRWQKTVFPGVTRRKKVMQVLLLAFALGALCLAFLRPQWGEKKHTIVQEGRDVVLLLDISRSMYAQDVKPNRLELTKLKIKKLLHQLNFERVALILFSGSAFVQCPLTADYKTFSLYLDQVTPESISVGTTAIGGALKKAIELFKRSNGRKNKLVLLVTDGEDFASDMAHVAATIQREQVTVLAWGVGSEQGAPVPIIDDNGVISGHERDAQGAVILTRLNSKFLQKISRDARGFYTTMSYDDSDISYLKTKLDSYEKEQFQENQELSCKHDRYPLCIAISFICLALEWLL